MEIRIEFTNAPIALPPPRLINPETGAEVDFRGIVRATEQDRLIAGLQYEAHVPMAEREIRRIVDQLNTAWSCHALWFIHRLGWVPVGETSLFIRVHASHRGGAFAFCSALIDQLKKDVPIWKSAPP